MNPPRNESASGLVKSPRGLHGQVQELREQLVNITSDYRRAVARHDRARVVELLRRRSDLMRQLLEAQCELLLAIRSETTQAAATAELEALAPGTASS